MAAGVAWRALPRGGDALRAARRQQKGIGCHVPRRGMHLQNCSLAFLSGMRNSVTGDAVARMSAWL